MVIVVLQVLVPLVNAVVVEASGSGSAQGPAGKGKAGLYIMLAVCLRTRPQVTRGGGGGRCALCVCWVCGCFVGWRRSCDTVRCFVTHTAQQQGLQASCEDKAFSLLMRSGRVFAEQHWPY